MNNFSIRASSIKQKHPNDEFLSLLEELRNFLGKFSVMGYSHSHAVEKCSHKKSLFAATLILLSWEMLYGTLFSKQFNTFRKMDLIDYGSSSSSENEAEEHSPADQKSPSLERQSNGRKLTFIGLQKILSTIFLPVHKHDAIRVTSNCIV